MPGRRDHRHSRRRLDAFVDDALEPDDVDRVVAHLLECPDCSAHVRLLLRVRASLRDLRHPAIEARV